MGRTVKPSSGGRYLDWFFPGSLPELSTDPEPDMQPVKITGTPPLLIQGMQGLGDNFYQRAVIRQLPRLEEAYLETPWPQLYEDLGIRLVKPNTRLRTQAKNINRPYGQWSKAPNLVTKRHLSYAGKPGTMLEQLFNGLSIDQPRYVDFSGPLMPVKIGVDPYIVIRPVTVRSEWPADARNQLPEDLYRVVERLRPHYRIFSVADLDGQHEWPVGELPYADKRFHKGELEFEPLMELITNAAAVVGGVGWLVPAAVAYQVPMFLMFGGWGLHNGPARIFDPRMETQLIQQVMPQNFCMCASHTHKCDKRIPDLDAQIELFLLRLAQRRKVDLAA